MIPLSALDRRLADRIDTILPGFADQDVNHGEKGLPA